MTRSRYGTGRSRYEDVDALSYHEDVDAATPLQRPMSTAGSSIHTSKSLTGPWEPLVPNSLPGCNNPAPWVHPNGTIYIVCGGGMLRADSIQGPWTHVSDLHFTGQGPAGNYEDPFVYSTFDPYHTITMPL